MEQFVSEKLISEKLLGQLGTIETHVVPTSMSSQHHSRFEVVRSYKVEDLDERPMRDQIKRGSFGFNLTEFRHKILAKDSISTARDHASFLPPCTITFASTSTSKV